MHLVDYFYENKRGVCVYVLHTYIHTYIHTHTYITYTQTGRQTDRSKVMSAFWQIDVAKTPTTYVVNVVCFAYLVFQFI